LPIGESEFGGGNRTLLVIAENQPPVGIDEERFPPFHIAL
jgi:hypothetical protein